MYIYAFDISLSNTGLAIFTKKGIPVKITSFPTSSKEDHPYRLKIIADSIIELRNIFFPSLMIYESGFSRYMASTQAIYKTMGVIQYLFSDCEQKSFAPSTIRKIVCGNGRANKKDVENSILKIWPNLSFENDDQSDSVGVGLCFFMQTGVIKNGKNQCL